ncbi:MAG: GNAT family N-acetyltransferase [Cryobacterium sp.]
MTGPGTSSVRVRPAAPHEFDRVADLVELGFRNGPYGHFPVSAARTALVRDSAGRAAAGALLVAVDERGAVDARGADDERGAVDGTDATDAVAPLLGTASLLRAGEAGSRLAQPGEIELRLIAVAPAARGRGIGEALVRAALHVAAEMGAGAVVLDTGSLNLPAQRLYERIGFQRQHDRVPTRLGGPGSPDEIPPLVYSFPLPQRP